MLTDKHKAMFRSFLTTVIGVTAVLVAIAAVPGVAIPATWVGVAAGLAGVARTALAWLDSGMPLYGLGSDQ